MKPRRLTARRKLILERFEQLGRMLRGDYSTPAEKPKGVRCAADPQHQRRARTHRHPAYSGAYADELGPPLVYRGKLYMPWPKLSGGIRPVPKWARKPVEKPKPTVRTKRTKREQALAQIADKVGKKLPKLAKRYSWQTDAY